MKTKSEIIWNEYSKELKRFVLSKVKDKESCKDILQEVFIKMHSNIHTLKNEEKVKSWLFQITRNAISDFYRTQKLALDVNEVVIKEEEKTSNANVLLSACMELQINKLPLIYKEALMKTEFQKYSQLQLAEELNISYSGAKSRVQRAKEMLKKYFVQCCNVASDKYGNIVSFSVKHNCKLCN